MIHSISDPRRFSVTFVNELCVAAAREASGPNATEAEVQLRAQKILAFICDWLAFPSLARH